MVAKIELELKLYNYKNNKSDDPVIPPLGYNLHTSITGLTYRLSWTKEVWEINPVRKRFYYYIK